MSPKGPDVRHVVEKALHEGFFNECFQRRKALIRLFFIDTMFSD